MRKIIKIANGVSFHKPQLFKTQSFNWSNLYLKNWILPKLQLFANLGGIRILGFCLYKFFMQTSNFSSNEGVYISKQLDAILTLSKLLVREINSLEESEDRILNSIEAEKPINLYEEIERFEEKIIRSALIRSMGRQTAAAKLLGMKLTTLNMKIKRYKIDLSTL